MDIQLSFILLSFAVLLSISIWRVRQGKDIAIVLSVAAIVTAAWTAVYGYAYSGLDGYFLGPINLYPFALWVTGLIVLREVYERTPAPYWKRFVYIMLLYWLILGVLEFIGFYILGIQITPSYPSLLNLGIFHTPPFAQAYYLSIGPIYLLVTDYLSSK